MTDYVVGDIQGCYDTLRLLLDSVKFDPSSDVLYCVGDLVNRGKGSLETLRFIRSLGAAGRTVLGNHDLHLICLYYGHRKPQSSDTLQAILAASDAEDLILWLKKQPLMIFDVERNFLISHAGLYPMWSVEQAQFYANRTEAALQSNSFNTLLEKMYSNKPDMFDADAECFAQHRFTINAFTRMRYCTKSAKLDFNETGPPASYKGELIPWFTMDHKRSDHLKVIFGHWSSLGLHRDNNVIAIDSGCVWGQALTLYNIDNDSFISVKSKE